MSLNIPVLTTGAALDTVVTPAAGRLFGLCLLCLCLCPEERSQKEWSICKYTKMQQWSETQWVRKNRQDMNVLTDRLAVVYAFKTGDA